MNLWAQIQPLLSTCIKWQRKELGQFLGGRRKPTHLTSGNIRKKAVSVVPSGSDKTDVRRENMDVRWVSFLILNFWVLKSLYTNHIIVSPVFLLALQVLGQCVVPVYVFDVGYGSIVLEKIAIFMFKWCYQRISLSFKT
jgi:hypothetical protein